MVIVRIKGGLGNQMFQYALGRRLALDWQDELKVDLTWPSTVKMSNIKKGDVLRFLEMDKFNVVLNQATKEEIISATPSFIFRIIDKIRGRLSKNHFYRFYPGLLKKKKNFLLDGYFQSYKYFDSIRDTLLKDFVLKNGYSKEGQEIKKEIEQTAQSVAIHVRRGEFVTTHKNYNGLCSLAYYEQAVDVMNKKYPNAKLFIFSDGIEWTKENFKFNNPMIFVSRPGLSSAEEILLMSLCKHQITANSTFSWWGAWLNKNPNKIVVTPKVVLAAADIKTDDLLPSDWIKI